MMKLVTVLVQFTIAVGAVGLLASCGSPVTQDDLAKRPEAHLFYPGSRVLETRGQNEQVTEGGTRIAEVITDLSVDAQPDQIYSWYSHELTAKGWTLRKSERVNGSFDLFTRGDRDLFAVALGASPGTYTTTLSIVPASCATTPPTKLAFANC
jgi:hypothetical protein